MDSHPRESIVQTDSTHHRRNYMFTANNGLRIASDRIANHFSQLFAPVVDISPLGEPCEAKGIGARLSSEIAASPIHHNSASNCIACTRDGNKCRAR
jgi:hypothetical protein